MAQLELELVNRLGLHARAAAKFVHTASRFASQISVAHNQEEVNGKSILGLLLLAAPCGSRLTVKAVGKDEMDALRALETLIQERFGEGE
ncbi:MAG: HPr family phosphocarrier protein [Thermoanaerobaculaceae bacterium]|nr:HPr family phosphocarrier protein [Thermoanaerobaculaceae bacterium]MDI9621731.1 HPr family phosphocarrier protein [Acidobacteriota bacterium]NLH12213.1 HPr family phosphocarrier protein [Holophagae bacterium]HPW56030.1 HPr family phosphocarrier protein [Thermoanaerobaculaceae bacterium]